jgi:hypothetical protein
MCGIASISGSSWVPSCRHRGTVSVSAGPAGDLRAAQFHPQRADPTGADARLAPRAGRAARAGTLRRALTADIVAELEKIGPEIANAWGFQPAFDGGWAADLWTVADKAVATAFRFLDLLSVVVLRNPLPETTSALLAGEVPDTLPYPVPWEGYDDYLPILLGQSIPADRTVPDDPSDA